MCTPVVHVLGSTCVERCGSTLLRLNPVSACVFVYCGARYRSDIVHVVTFALSVVACVDSATKLHVEQICGQLLSAMALVAGPWLAVKEMLVLAAEGGVRFGADVASSSAPASGQLLASNESHLSGAATGSTVAVPGVEAFLNALMGSKLGYTHAAAPFNPLASFSDWGFVGDAMAHDALVELAMLHWPSLLNPCPLSANVVATLVARRHELCDWAYPKLSADEQAAAAELEPVRGYSVAHTLDTGRSRSPSGLSAFPASHSVPFTIRGRDVVRR